MQFVKRASLLKKKMFKKFSRFSSPFHRLCIHMCTSIWSINTWLCNERCAKRRGIFFPSPPPCPFILDTYPSFGWSTGFTDYENNSREIDPQLRRVHFYRDSPAIVRKTRSKDLCKWCSDVSLWNIIGRVFIFICVYIFLSLFL